MLDTLISASLEAQDISWLERFPKFMMSDLEKDAVTWVVAYSRKYKHTPTAERFKASDHGIFLTKHLVTSPLKDLYERALENKRREYFYAKYHELEAILDGGDDLPLAQVIQLGRDLASVNEMEDDSLFSIDRDDLYSEDKPDGLTFGYDVLDSATGGIMRGEYGLLVARTGVGKTLITCHLALRWARAGKKVLVISCEMPTRQLVARIDAMIGGFNSRMFRVKDNPALMQLSRNRVERELEAIKANGGDIIFPKSRSVSVGKLRGMIADRRPDAVIVDGVYLLHSDDKGPSSDWQRLKASSNELKQICLEEDIPVFATSQLKRTGKEDGYTLEDIAYSDSLGQDTDLVLVANKFANVANQITVEILKNRNGEGYGGTVLKVDWDTTSLIEVGWGDVRTGDEEEEDDEK